MKVRISHWVFIGVTAFLVAGIACVIYESWYDLYGKGVLGTASSIAEIPYAKKDFAGLNAEGPFVYTYKKVPRHIRYMFAGRISEDDFKEFFSAEEGWLIESLCLAEYVDSFEDFHVDVSNMPLAKPLVNEPLQDGHGNCNDKYAEDLYAYRDLPFKGGGGTKRSERIYFRKDEHRFFAHVMRSYRE